MSTDATTEATTEPRRRIRLRYVIPAVLAVPVLALVVLAAVVATSKPTIVLNSAALAKVTTAFGGGRIAEISAVGGREQRDIPVTLRGDEVWPTTKVRPGEQITVVATVDRPSWISWLTGSAERVTLTEVAPVARVQSTFLTRAAGQPVEVKFARPVQVAGTGTPGTNFDPHALSTPEASLTLSTSAPDGTVAVAAAVRSWESPSTTNVSWFPRGKKATVVALPAPGTRITPSTPITLTFSKPVSAVLGRRRPPVNPITPGVWHTVNAHTIVFRPTGYGYGLGADVQVLLPSSVRLIGAKRESAESDTATTPTTGTTTTGSSTDNAYPVVGNWTVPQPSTLALQELLAELGYLPVNFTPNKVKATRPPKPTQTTTGTTTTVTTNTTTTTPGTTTSSTATQATTTSTGSTSTANAPDASAASTGNPSATASRAVRGAASTVAKEESEITHPLAGRFSWRYPHTPAQLKRLWSPTQYTELTKGAIMAFENAEGMTTDGIAGPAVWKALINAAVKGQKSTFGYTFVEVSESLPESERTWHNGKIVVSGPVNTGIAAAPTALGTFAVYEHLTVTTMSGLNPNGTPYDDPGIPWVSYFNGGDALHGFIRASYGFPQSLGCVEMPFAEAGQVWPYTPIGTIVQVS